MNDKKDLWEGLGLAAVILAVLVGIGSCGMMWGLADAAKERARHEQSK